MLLPLALGHLARFDPRALDELRQMLRHAETPEWSYRAQAGRRLARALDRACVQGLGLSGRATALDDEDESAVIERASVRAAARLRLLFNEARALRDRIRRQGAERALGGSR